MFYTAGDESSLSGSKREIGGKQKVFGTAERRCGKFSQKCSAWRTGNIGCWAFGSVCRGVCLQPTACCSRRCANCAFRSDFVCRSLRVRRGRGFADGDSKLVGAQTSSERGLFHRENSFSNEIVRVGGVGGPDFVPVPCWGPQANDGPRHGQNQIVQSGFAGCRFLRRTGYFEICGYLQHDLAREKYRGQADPTLELPDAKLNRSMPSDSNL